MGQRSTVKAPEPELRGHREFRVLCLLDMGDLPTSWAESGLESNPLCFKARALFEPPRFQESRGPAQPSFSSQ